MAQKINGGMNYLTNYKDFIKVKINEAIKTDEKKEIKTNVNTMVKELQAEFEKIMKDYDDLYQ